MNYEFRNRALWRWCLITFVASVIISLVSILFEPWGWVVPTGLFAGFVQLLPSWLDWLAPRWLDWSLTNTLFVLAYVWTRTGRIFVAPLWGKHPPTKLLRAVLQGLVVACFCGVYNLWFLLIAPIVLSTITFVYFMEEFDQLLDTTPPPDTSCYYDYDDHEASLFDFEFPSYGPSSIALFFYTIIVFYGLYKFGPTFNGLELFVTFIGAPLAYALMLLGVILALVVALIILGLVFLLLEWVYNQAKKYVPIIWEEFCYDARWWGDVFTDAFLLIIQGLAMVGGFVFVASVLMMGILICLWEYAFPPRPIAPTVQPTP